MGEEKALRGTAASLQGDPVPSLGPLGAPPPEDVEAVERQRQRLQTSWKLLQTTGKDVTNPNTRQDLSNLRHI